MSTKLRRLMYDHADYIARKHFFVHIHELPDGKRREVLKAAWEQIKEFIATGRV